MAFLESAAKVIIKMLAVGIPTYSMDLLALDQEKKQLIQLLNNWYIENIVEKENFKRTAMDGMLSVWCAKNERENLYFAVNGAKEVTVDGKDFQLLNASMYEEIFIRAEESANYHLEFYDHRGNLVEEIEQADAAAIIRIKQPVMLVKGRRKF